MATRKKILKEGDRWLDTKELMKHTHYSKRMITYLRNEGKIPYYKPGGRNSKVLYLESEINDWIMKGKVI